jgi:NADP-dependent 3-hydroxy acid dehydrogenase YdfG
VEVTTIDPRTCEEARLSSVKTEVEENAAQRVGEEHAGAHNSLLASTTMLGLVDAEAHIVISVVSSIPCVQPCCGSGGMQVNMSVPEIH